MAAGKKCATKRCRRAAQRKDPLCPRCRSRWYAENHPLRYAYNNLRKRARQRGHAFELSYEDYERFAKETGYDKLKGKHATSLSIDRIDPARGYRLDNIRAVTLSENSRLRYAPLPGWLKQKMIEETETGEHGENPY